MARVVSGPEITGQVVSRQTGSPIAGATVTVSATVYTDPDFTSGTTTLTANGRGEFFCYAGNGTYTFTTTAQGAGPIESVTVRGTGGGGSGSGASATPTIINAGNLGAAYTLTLTAQETWLVGTLNANTVITVAGMGTGRAFRAFLTQDGTGSRTVSVSDGTTTAPVPVNSTGGVLTVVSGFCPTDTTLDVASNVGATGPAGATGATGPAGPTGAAGPAGSGAGGELTTLMLPAITAGSPWSAFGSTGQAMTAARAYVLRALAPKTGTIIGLYIGVVSASGNARGAVYDCGQAVGSGTRTKLWEGTDTALVNGWLSLGNPGVAVTAGKHYSLVAMLDNATATVIKAQSSASFGGVAPGTSGASPDGVSSSLVGYFGNVSVYATTLPTTVGTGNYTSIATNVFPWIVAEVA